MKINLQKIDSTQSELTLDTEAIDIRESVENIPEITENNRQRSDESTRSSEENIFPTDRMSLRFKTAEIFDKFSKKYHHDNSKLFDKLLSSLDRQLHNNLNRLLEQKKEGGLSGASYYELGAIYQKQHKVDEILGRDSEESNSNITKAIYYFDKAIKHTPKTTEYHNSLAKYHAHRAKCFYSNNNNDDASTECLAAFAYNTQDYDAHEVMGYIHRAEGKYNLALSSFERSSSNSKKDIHYVKALYNQSIVLAALGKQEEALLTFNLANDMPIERLDLEDQVLAMAMRDPQYQNLIRDLVALSNEQVVLDNSNEYIHYIVNNIYPGSSSPSKIGGYSQKLSSIIQDLENEKTAHLKDEVKMKATLKKLESKEYAYIEKSDRKQDLDLDTFYTEVKKLLIARYHAAEVISTEWVENGKTGDIGDVARTVSFIEEFIPVPKAFTLPMKITSVALENLDKYYQEEYLKKFYEIADSEKEMKTLSKNIASRLTYLRKVSREDHEDDISIKSHTSNADIKSLAKSDAKNIVEFISDVIFAGRITADSIEEKSNMIIALVKLDQDFKNDSIKELPPYARDVAIKTLETMQESVEYWHSNKALEETFVDRLANNINHLKIPEHMARNDLFVGELARNLFHNDDIVTYVHRTVRFWQKKAMLKESFLSSENYFNRVLVNVERKFSELLEVATVVSGGGDMSDHSEHLGVLGDDMPDLA